MPANYFGLPDTCQKCGFVGLGSPADAHHVAVWSDPRFRRVSLGATGYLEFRCNRCGYEVVRPTVDERKPGNA